MMGNCEGRWLGQSEATEREQAFVVVFFSAWRRHSCRRHGDRTADGHVTQSSRVWRHLLRLHLFIFPPSPLPPCPVSLSLSARPLRCVSSLLLPDSQGWKTTAASQPHGSSSSSPPPSLLLLLLLHLLRSLLSPCLALSPCPGCCSFARTSSPTSCCLKRRRQTRQVQIQNAVTDAAFSSKQIGTFFMCRWRFSLHPELISALLLWAQLPYTHTHTHTHTHKHTHTHTHTHRNREQ